ncbi:MAG: glycosyltransferase family 1 protein [Clostridia bacterium]|nr:glycosyltransferase family 1 protein [Clostridia bacterium]
MDTLCFSINPLYHNPVGLYAYPKDNAVLFAGTWMTKYPERLADMRVMFDGVLGAGYRLKILDRCFSRFNTRYVFPQKYWKFVSPEISHEYLQKVHKLYNWAININTIKDSATMFANRVYELQANGNLMISNHSVGVEKMFPGIFVVDTEEDVIRALTSLTAEEIFAKQTEGVRRVMTGETCFDRVGKILRAAGIKASQPERKVLVFAQNVDFAKKICENQSYKAGRVEVAALDSLSDDRIKSYDIIAFMDESENYDSFYLEDMINGFKYTACDYITQDPAVRHGYVGVMKNRNRTVFWQEAFAADRLASFEGVTELKNGYSTGRTTSAFNALASHNS